MKIGEISKHTGLSLDTIRFYEKSGLIGKPERLASGYRHFNEELVDVLKFISRCRSLDISLNSVKKLLRVRSRRTKSCREANEVIDEQIARLRERIIELKSLERTLTQLRSVCNQELAPEDCRIIKGIQSI